MFPSTSILILLQTLAYRCIDTFYMIPTHMVLRSWPPKPQSMLLRHVGSPEPGALTLCPPYAEHLLPSLSELQVETCNSCQSIVIAASSLPNLSLEHYDLSHHGNGSK
ncbi:hypothetical protein BJ912DRAFT_610627 [Pholiota molesta]|nr:hypothetical protein BJ912DRAFT_610627 [Pholiota molesta]